MSNFPPANVTLLGGNTLIKFNVKCLIANVNITSTNVSLVRLQRLALYARPSGSLFVTISLAG